MPRIRTDRATRCRAGGAGCFYPNSGELDAIYDQLVKLRHGMALKLGFKSYTPAGIPAAATRDLRTGRGSPGIGAGVQHVVPCGTSIGSARKENGWDRLRSWDEALIDPSGIRNGGRPDCCAGRSGDVRRDGPRLASFYRLMHDGRFMDLRTAGKAGGCFLHILRPKACVHLCEFQRHEP